MKRVVVTGMGVISPIGLDYAAFADSLKQGRVGIGPITKIDVAESPIKLAAQANGFDPEAAGVPKKEIRRMDTYCQFAMAAAKQAVDMSGLDTAALNPRRFGVIVGSGIGGMETFERDVVGMYEKGGFRIAPLFIPMMIGNIAAGNIAIMLGAKGICTSVVTACTTSANCIGEAYRHIKHGYSDVIVAGGAEATITRGAIAGFAALKALSPATDPARASIPFDKERNGFVMGEGAGIVVLENYGNAIARGATIYAEIVGYGTNCDAYHMTAPSPDGAGAADCMLDAMAEAGITPADVGYINAHGTSTQLNDSAETMAVKRAFGDAAGSVYISSTKSMTGHLLGAAGAIETIACIAALKGGFIPPTMGYKTPDADCDLNYSPNAATPAEFDYALTNSLGFGGHNASLCIKK